MMRLIVAVFVFSGLAAAQTFVDFPAGYGNVPERALKGPVHTVLTIEQRDDHVFRTEVEVYDERGRIIERLDSNANVEVHSGKLVRLGGKRTYTYDDSGRLLRVNSFGPEGNLWSYAFHKYDEKRRLIEISRFDASGQSRGWTRYSYAADKKEVEATWQFIYPPEPARGTPMRSILVFDSNGRWTARTMFLSSEDTVTFAYDTEGNVEKEMHAGFGYSFTYKTDKYGNWIERVRDYYESKDGNQRGGTDMNTYRMITYYPELKIGMAK